jgi:Ca2+-binding RTX toxin-like protein
LIGSPGADQMTGGAGQDRFDYADRSEAGDTITDFQLGRAGDVLDLVDLVSFDPLSDTATDFVRLTAAGGDTRVAVDADGGGNGFRSFVTLAGVTATDVDVLVTDGNLVLA